MKGDSKQRGEQKSEIKSEIRVCRWHQEKNESTSCYFMTNFNLILCDCDIFVVVENDRLVHNAPGNIF